MVMDTLLVPSSIGGTGSATVSRNRTPPWIRPMKRTSQHVPSTTASIPSRYQTFFYSNSESKGFNSQATRFPDHLGINENPGPGTYKTQPNSSEKISVSYSKKGAGGLASRKERFSRTRLEVVGPGSYTPRLTTNHLDFNRANTTKNFHPPIAQKRENALGWSPAPNTYHINTVQTEKNRMITGEAAFKSRTPRAAHSLNTASNPGPDKYEVVDRLVHPSICPYKSVFNSKSPMKDFPRPKMGPGPADYSPRNYKPTAASMKGAKSSCKHHILCFSAPALPLPPVPPQPGPGHYEIINKMALGTEKETDASGAAFKSITGRMAGDKDAATRPGPGHYDPVSRMKRSYFYNVHSVWV